MVPPAPPRLSLAGIGRLPVKVQRPQYELPQRAGIVHLGLGAFHRAHQAVYTDDAMAAGARDWRITGVSLRSAQVREQLEPQDGLYTVTQSGNSGQRSVSSAPSAVCSWHRRIRSPSSARWPHPTRTSSASH